MRTTTTLLTGAMALLLIPVLTYGQSLQDDLDNAQPGDVIEFSGTQSGTFETKVHGTASNPIIIRGIGSNAVIDGGGTGSGFGLDIRHDYYRLENFTIRNCKKGLYIYDADHGIATSIHVEDIGQEAVKVKRNSSYWLFQDCTTSNTGLSGDYGEGFYVGDADSNWESSSQADTPGYITFLNCTATDPINDGFDLKEGAHHVKYINCTARWINVTPESGHGNSGYYSRGNDIQYINCSSEGNDSGGPAFKHYQTDASDGNRYGYRIELKELLIKDHTGSGIHFHRQDISSSSTMYDDYTTQNLSGDLWHTGAIPPIVSASQFVEMTWSGEGGDTYYNGGTQVPVTGVSVSPSSLSLEEGEPGSLTATVSPSNATNQNVSWSSANTSIATVNASGVVTGVAAGTVTITATTADGGYTDQSEVTVTEGSSTGPTVSFTTPSDGSTFNVGDDVYVEVSAAHASGISSVSLYLNGSLVRQENTAPYTWGADISLDPDLFDMSAGSYTLEAVATAGDNSTNSTSISFDVSSGGGGGCTFDPLATALPTMDTDYDYVHVIGQGPSLSNFREFTINWSLANNGLYQFALNTDDGNPDWYVNLVSDMTFDFNSSQPDFTLSGSGFPGLDGDYWVTVDNGNFVWIAKSGDFSLYFSNSATDPCGSGSRTFSASAADVGPEAVVNVYPNPVTDFLTIVQGVKKGDLIAVYSMSGQKMLSAAVTADEKGYSLDLRGLQPGVYLLKLSGHANSRLKLIKN